MKFKLFVTALAALFAMSFQLSTAITDTESSRPWELLGVKKVNYGLDRDEIDVTASEGSFTGLKIKVKHSPINMHKLAVHFGNGEVQEIELRENFRAGSESRIIDLPGNRRVIRKVVIWYDTKNLAIGKGMVELWGRH
ncbi:MAG: hypothetical protein IT262_09220 [Saprospiraceae bacterium]|nr:hypothetical protein [Saprospiraceae bacterium]